MSGTLLAQLIGAKFSHELSGVLGAIKNSMECIEHHDSSVKDQSFKLAFCASAVAVARLRFLREIYGYSHPGEYFNSAKLKSLAEEFFRGRDVKVELEGEEYIGPTWTSGSYAKLLLCIVVLSQNHLASSGIVKISFASSGHATVEVYGKSLNAPSEQMVNILTAPLNQQGMSVFNVHEHYSRELADSIGVSIKISSSDEEVIYSLSIC